MTAKALGRTVKLADDDSVIDEDLMHRPRDCSRTCIGVGAFAFGVAVAFGCGCSCVCVSVCRCGCGWLWVGSR
jgi:hypothetical protein